MIKAVFESVFSPITATHFAHWFISDIMTSVPRMFSDFQYTMCFYFTKDFLRHDFEYCTNNVAVAFPVVSVFPLWVRFWQCMRRFYYTMDLEHAGNAGKYLCSLVTHVFGALHPAFANYSPEWSFGRGLWFVSFLIATCYLFYWDVAKDWGLGCKNRKTYFLRNRIIFPPPLYFLVILLDAIGRFCWAWTMTTWTIPHLNPQFNASIFAYVELFRRAMWGIFRMENEHLSNVGKFSAYLDVTLPQDIAQAEQERHQKSLGYSVQVKCAQLFACCRDWCGFKKRRGFRTIQ